MIEIWSDQPPVFTLFLKTFFDFFGTNIQQARIFSIIISILGIVVIYAICRQYTGFYISTLAVLFLISNYVFAQYSTLILIGFPAIIFGLFSIYLISIKKNSNLLPVLSGVFFGLSIFTKLFTLLYLIPIAIHLFLNDKSFKKLILFILPVLLVSMCIVLNFNLYEYKPLLMPHLNLMNNQSFDIFSRLDYINEYVPRYFTILSIIAFIVLLFRFKKKFLMPLLLFIVSCCFILICSPIFEHHLIFLLIPSILILAICISELGEMLSSKITYPGVPLIFSVICFILLIFSIPQYSFLELDIHLEKKYNQILKTLYDNGFKAQDSIFCDLPIIPFLMKAKTDPVYAVFSRKRVNAGFLKYDDVGSHIIQAQPNFVIFARFKELKSDIFYEKYLKSSYSLVFEITDGIYSNSPVKIFKHI